MYKKIHYHKNRSKNTNKPKLKIKNNYVQLPQHEINYYKIVLIFLLLIKKYILISERPYLEL